MKRIFLFIIGFMILGSFSYGMNKLNTLNEKEQRDAVYSALKKDGVKITKTLLNKVMDKQNDLMIQALTSGKGIKISGLGSIVVATHKARAFKVPNGKGGFITGLSPAGFHVRFDESAKLYKAMNNFKLN